VSIFGARFEPLIIRDLTKRYGEHRVLEGIDLTVQPGTVTAVTGANGCGKSTLLRCLAGLARHRGAVTYRGRPVSGVRADIGYLPQSVGLPGWATVDETVAFFARLRAADPASTPFPEGFLPAGDRTVGVLSGGQRQRLALALAFLGAPSLLLLDEPFANLDDTSRDTLWGALAGAVADGASAVVATPIDSDLGPLPRAVVEIVDGRITAAPRRRDGSSPNGRATARTEEVLP
jgi:ABC-2 type transport system ATP-binding protein